MTIGVVLAVMTSFGAVMVLSYLVAKLFDIVVFALMGKSIEILKR